MSELNTAEHGSAVPGTDVPIAIIGLGAVYPKAADLTEFWDNVLGEIDCITDIPADHWSVDDYYHPDPRAEDRTYSKRGGFIPEISFDPLEFGIPPRTVEATSVLQLLSLVVAKATMQDSGCFDSTWFNGNRSGVVLGAAGGNSLLRDMISRMQAPVLKEILRASGLDETESEEIAKKWRLAYAPWQENSFPGVLGNVVAGRIANRFDLGALNCTTDAACASSLAAINMAASELALGRADFMIAGGCDLENSPIMYLCFSKTPALSFKGECRPFDDGNDGTLVGQGIGMLGLKRLADAQRDGDRVYAVIKGTGSSSDGRFKSIYAPRVEGQVDALNRAYAAAGVAPESVRLLEAHGTGTPIGDQVEVAALKEIFGSESIAKQSIAIGSVKSQIGHTKCAAGAAGMIKAALALHYKVLPPTINVVKPNVHMGIAESPFYPNASVRPWITDPSAPVRRAGVSAFGFGGTNFHCVLEEAPTTERGVDTAHRGVLTYFWHAASPELLVKELLADPERRACEEDVPSHHARAAIVALRGESIADRRAALITHIGDSGVALPEGVFFGTNGVVGGKVAALFAGQGSQYVDMGAGAAIAFPAVRSAFDEMSAGFGDVAFGRIVFPPSAFAPAAKKDQEAALRATEYAQPAIGALSQGQFTYMQELGFAPEGALGHSFGELTALWAAGSIDDDTFRSLARARGRAMANAPKGADVGTMAAIAASVDDVTRMLEEHTGVRVCNVNAPTQTVVGGGTEDVAAFVDACTAAGVGARTLPVAAAFHTPLVAHAVSEFTAELATVSIGDPGFPVYANTAGAVYGTDSDTNRSVLTEQIVNPVLFAERVEQLYADGFRVFVEFGPKSLLAGLVRATLGECDDVTVLSADGGPRTDGELHIMSLAAHLAVLGVPLSGLNRGVQAAKPPASAPSKAAILLNGHEYVPEERRLSYQDTLDNGYRIERSNTLAHNEPAVEQPEAPPADVGTAVHVTAPSASPGTRSAVWDIAEQHLSMHRAFLSSQLQIADRVSTLLTDEASGVVRREVIDGIDAVARHSTAISEGHVHASNTLRSFAELESGTAGESGSAGYGASSSPSALGSTYRAAALPASDYLDSHRSSEPYKEPAESYSAPPSNGYAASNGHGSNGHGSNGHGSNGHGSNGHSSNGQSASVGLQRADETAYVTPISSGLAESASTPGVPMTSAAIGELMLEVVADKTGYPPDMLDLNMAMEGDLGIDSIKRVEILSSLQESYPDIPPPPPEEIFQLSSLQDVVDYLYKLVSGDVDVDVDVDVDNGIELTAGVMSNPKAERGSGIVRRRIRTVRLPAADELVDAYRADRVAVVVGARTTLSSEVVKSLRDSGWTVVTERATAGDLEHLDLAIWMMPDASVDRELADVQESLVQANLFAGEVLSRLVSGAEDARTAFLAVTRVDGELGLRRPDYLGAVAAGVSGLVKTVALESPHVFSRTVDIDPSMDVAAAGAALLAELSDCTTTLGEIGIDCTGSRITLAPSSATETLTVEASERKIRLGADDLVLVTGGARGITASCVLALAAQCEANFLLVGSTPVGNEPEWAQGVADGDLKRAYAAHAKAVSAAVSLGEIQRCTAALVSQRQVQQTLDRLNAGAPRAVYLPVDITDAAAVRAALGPVAAEITGFVHGAGTLLDRRIEDKSSNDIRTVLAPKLFGFSNVLDVLDPAKLKHVVAFTSVAGFYGNVGQSDYAIGNEALNRLAVWLGAEYAHASVTAINWGPWEGGMVRPELAKLFRERGVEMIDITAGAEVFAQLFTRGPGTAVELAGPRVHPVSRPRIDGMRGELTVRRNLAPLYGSAVLHDHRIGGTSVVPATFANGGLINIVGQLRSENPQVWTGFTVLKGIVLDGSEPGELTVDVRRNDDGSILAVAKDDKGRPRYRTTVLPLSHRPPAPLLLPLPKLDSGEVATVYEDGIMFHQAGFQGVKRILCDTDSQFIAQCELQSATVAGGAYETDTMDPVLYDVMHQSAAIWVRRLTGASCLPATAGRFDSYQRPPRDAPFFVVCTNFSKRSANIVTVDVGAYDGAGRCIVLMTAVEAVTSAALNEVFATGVPSEA